MEKKIKSLFKGNDNNIMVIWIPKNGATAIVHNLCGYDLLSFGKKIIKEGKIRLAEEKLLIKNSLKS